MKKTPTGKGRRSTKKVAATAKQGVKRAASKAKRGVQQAAAKTGRGVGTAATKAGRGVKKAATKAKRGAKQTAAQAKRGATKAAASVRPPARPPRAGSRAAAALTSPRPPATPSNAPRVPVTALPFALGAHVSSAGGTPNAPPRAKAIGATAMQIFSKMANRWAERACQDDECVAFRAALADTGVSVTIAHDSYLINLASPDPVLRARSVDSFVAELQRCNALGLHYLVSHPGNYMDERASGLARNADAIARALERAPGQTRLCLETTAGSGTGLGATFEELAEIIELIPGSLRDRVGVCVDTCHIHSAGYDLVNDYDAVIDRFDDTVGLDRMWVMHLNDSKTPFASRRDRHELIGEGSLGARPFQRIMTDPRLAHVPKVIETPKLNYHEATDRWMLGRLLEYAAAGGDAPSGGGSTAAAGLEDSAQAVDDGR